MPVVARHRFGLMLAAILFGLLPLAAPAADRARLEAFLEVTGFDVSLDSIAMSAEHAPAMLGMEAGDFAESWRKLAERTFDPPLMRDMALDILEETLSDDLLNHAARFYASDLGQRLVTVENAAHMHPDDAARRREGAALIARDRADDGHRTRLLRQLNTAVDGTGQSVRAIQQVQLRFVMAASQAGVLGYRVDEGALRAMLREGEAALRAEIAEAALNGAAHTYRDIGEADLRAYLDALRHPKMQRVYELMNAVQHEVTANRFEALAVALADVTGGREL